MTNEFYDISENKDILQNEYQLKNLGTEKIFATFFTAGRDDNFSRNRRSNSIYVPVKSEDYDRLFARDIANTKPPYLIDAILNHHYNYFLKKRPEDSNTFLLHMEFVIVPYIQNLNKKNSEVYCTLIKNWINSIKKPSKIMDEKQIHNTINIENLNSPTQFVQNSDNVQIVQNINNSNEEILNILSLIRKDLEKTKPEQKADFIAEIDYAERQIERKKDVKNTLLEIGSLIKDVGINVFANLVASPIYEAAKPLLGLDG